MEELQPAPIKQRAARGFLWTSVAALSARLVQVLTNLLLARLLVPDDFGLVSVALVVINSLALLRDMGMAQALIHRRRDIDRAADTAFIMLPLVGAVMAAAAMLLAPAIAAFFDIPDTVSIIRVLAIGLLLSAFGLVPATLLERELSFGRRFVPEILPVIGYSAVAVAGAAYGLGAWSLVAGELTRSFLLATVIWPFSRWRPRLSFDRRLARELFSYGRHILAAGIAIFLFSTLDNAGIAKGLGAEQLGFYVLAFTLGTMPATQVGYTVGRVLFPAYSSMQHEPGRLANAYAKSVAYVSAAVAPIALGTLAIGPVFMHTLYGDKWDQSVLVLQILSFYGLFRAIGGASGEILKAVGRPHLLARISFFQLVAAVLPLYPVIVLGYGIEGVGFLFTLAMFLGVAASVVIASRVIDAPLKIILYQTFHPLALSGGAALLSYFVTYRVLGGSGVVALLAGIGVFAAIYLLGMLLFRRQLVVELGGLLRGAVSAAER